MTEQFPIPQARQIDYVHYAVTVGGKVWALFPHDHGNDTLNAKRAQKFAERMREQGINAQSTFVNPGQVYRNDAGFKKVHGRNIRSGHTTGDGLRH